MRQSRTLRHVDKVRLSADHSLEVTVTESSSADAETLTLKGDMAGVSSDELTCVVTSKKERDVEVASILKLKGRWQADGNNRLSFAVSKEGGRRDILVLDGVWEIGKDNELLYRYKKTGLVTKTKEERILVFRGAWRLTDRDKIAYLLDTSGKSGFLFKAQLENTGIAGRFGVLRYRLGIGVSERKRPVEKVIKFFGTLHLDLTKRDSLEFEFTDERGRRLGMAATLSRKLLGGEAFLRFKRLALESKVEGGLKFPW